MQRNNNDTVDGLARTIGLAPATIRRHLDILQRDRLVAFEEVRKRTGRPEYSFYLTEDGQEALPKDYDQLLGMIVQELSAMTPDETRDRSGQEILEQVFLQLSEGVASSYEAALSGASLSHRLEALVGHLGRENFSPETEEVDGTIRIRLLNCPFRSAALQNKAVCTYDLNLISSMLELDVEREQCIHDGDRGCMYTAAVGAVEAGRDRGRGTPSPPRVARDF